MLGPSLYSGATRRSGAQRSSELLEHARHPSVLGGGIGGDFQRVGLGDFGHSLRELVPRDRTAEVLADRLAEQWEVGDTGLVRNLRPRLAYPVIVARQTPPARGSPRCSTNMPTIVGI